MNFRRLMQYASVCLAFCSHAAAQVNPGSNFLFHLPVPGSNGTRVVGYLANTNDLNPDLDTTGPANPSQILPTPDGSRVYLVADGALQVFSTTLQTLQGVNGIAGPIRNITMTPDGKYLLVAGAQFYILSTATNGVVATNLGISGAVADFAVSPDSQTAWVLQSIPFFSSITPINLTTLTAGTKTTVQRAGETITYSTQGKLYVPSRNNISEYDATTLTFIRDTVMQALPGRLHFNLEGTRAYFIDKSETQGFAILAFNPATQVTTGWPTNIFTTYRPIFDEIYVAGPGRIFGLERSKTTLWEITDNPLSAAPANMAAFDSSVVFAAAVTTEIPSSRYLYVLTENSARPTLERVTLSSGALDTFANALAPTGTLRYVGIPPQTGASEIIKFNDSQVLEHGGPAKTLFAYVTDPQGRPVYNQPVTFTTDSASSTLTITNASERTNAEGFVQAKVTVPDIGGTYTVNLTAGGATAAFTFTVPITGGGGDGGGGGSAPRMIIVRGDGQLIAEGDTSAYWAPLTVRVVDPSGNPQAGVQVNFGVLNGIGAVFPDVTTSDQDGLVAATYSAFGIPQEFAFLQSVIRASSSVGSVEFSEIIFRKSLVAVDTIPMQQSLLTPDRATVRRGDIMPRLFAFELHSSRSPQIGAPIEGYGIRAGADFNPDPNAPSDFTFNSPAGSCVNNTRSDVNGVATCDFQVSCSLGSAAKVQFVVGEVFISPMVLLPTAGSGRLLNLVSGNNQSANIGQSIPNRLAATVTDNCGDPVPNKAVTWVVTQGSATLTGQVSQTDGSGRISTGVTMGQAAGVIKVTVSTEGATPLEFTLNATVTVSGISLTSGGGQSVFPGEVFPVPVVFTLRTSAGTTVGANISVNFALTGSGVLGNTQALTNSAGQVQTTVTAGSNPGPLTVTATYSNLSASASLTVRSPTLPLTAASFSNAASGIPGLVPCGLATVVGNGLAPNPIFLSGISPFGPLPYTLGTIDSLRVNNVPAPIQAVSNQGGKQQVNFQVPCETAVGNATVVITVNGVVTTISNVPVLQGQPGIFTYLGPNSKIYGAVLRPNGSYVGPSNPAQTGESLFLVLTGLGLVTPATTTNSAGTNQLVNLTAVVGVNNGGVPTQPARYLQGQIGVYIVEFTIPKTSTAAPGTVLLTDTELAVFVNVNGQAIFSQPGVLLPGVVQGQ